MLEYMKFFLISDYRLGLVIYLINQADWTLNTDWIISWIHGSEVLWSSPKPGHHYASLLGSSEAGCLLLASPRRQWSF